VLGMFSWSDQPRKPSLVARISDLAIRTQRSDGSKRENVWLIFVPAASSCGDGDTDIG